MRHVECRSINVPHDGLAQLERSIRASSNGLQSRLAGSVEQVAQYLRLARQGSGWTRLHDDAFPHLDVVWQWLGDRVGAAHVLRDGRLEQVHIMVSPGDADNDTAARAVVNRWLEDRGVGQMETPRLVVMPDILSLHTDSDASESGAYLLGILLFAPFCNACEAAKHDRRSNPTMNSIDPTPEKLPGLGYIDVTPDAAAALTRAGQSALDLLRPYMAGDWGELDADQRRLNERAVIDGNAMFGQYRTRAGDTICILTEADQSVTTLMMFHEA